MRQLLIRLLLWILRKLGWQPDMGDLPVPVVLAARMAVAQVEQKFKGTSGEFRRAQALRMILNITNCRERDAALAIERCLRQ